MSLSHVHTYISYCICTHSHMLAYIPYIVYQYTINFKTLRHPKINMLKSWKTQTQRQTLLSELQLKSHAALCWTPVILAVSRWVSPLLHHPPAHPPPAPLHPSFSSVFCLSVKQMCAQNKTGTNALIIWRYWIHPNALRMPTQWGMCAFICYLLFDNQLSPRQLMVSFNSCTWSEVL